jgi:DNA-3-methyladenine glycosylase
MEERAQGIAVARTKDSGAPSFSRSLRNGWENAAPLPRSFYEHSPDLVAPRLLGKILVHRAVLPGIGGSVSAGSGLAGRSGETILAGRIVEVEAYLGPHNSPPDPAAHAHRGPTPRNEVLFGAAGHAYVYSIYGRYFCLNVSCEPAGRAGGVLLRALEPVAGLETMARNRGLTITGPDAKPGASPDKGPASEKLLRELAAGLTSGPGRLCQALGLSRAAHNGLDYTDPDSPLQILDDGFTPREALVTPRIGIKEAVDWPLRFAIPGHSCVSGKRNLTGKLIRIP